MSLALTANTRAVAPTLQTYFVASGGTPPYSYSVVPGGIGGIIHPSSGLYTAPAITGQDTIKVIDSLGAFTTHTILSANALELFCDIIQSEMNLDDGRVYLWDQKIDMPKDHGLYIAVGVISCKPFANNNRYVSNGPGLDAAQYTSFLATLSVDIISRGPDARDRKEEIILALNSNYAQSQQEMNSFYIGKISSAFMNLSQEDGAAIPYRFNISVNIQYSIAKTKPIEYYDQFQDVDVTEEP